MTLRTNLALIMANSLMGGIYFCILMPLGGLLMAERGVPVWQIGLLGTIPWAATLAAVVGVPLLVTRFRPRSLYLLARWFLLAAAMIFFLSSNLYLWAFGYLLLGLSGGISWVIGDALLATLPPAENRARVMSFYMFLVNFNIILGPLSVAVMGTTPLWFTIGVAMAAINLLIGYAVQFPVREQDAKPQESITFMLQSAAPIIGLLIVAMASGSSEGAAIKMLPVQAYGLGYTEKTAAFAAMFSGAGNLLSQLMLMQLLRYYSPHKLFRPGLLLLAITSLLIVPMSGYILNYLAILFIVGGIAGALYTLVVLEVTTGADSDQGVRLISCIAAFYTLGGVVGPFVAGTMMEHSLLWGYSLAMALISLFAWAFYRRYPVKIRPDIYI